MGLKKVYLRKLLLTTASVCFAWATTAHADLIERKSLLQVDCSSALQISTVTVNGGEIRQTSKLAIDFRLDQPRTFSIQTDYPDLAKKKFDVDQMRKEFSRSDNRIEINFSKLSSVMKLIYSVARWGTLAPVNEVR